MRRAAPKAMAAGLLPLLVAGCHSVVVAEGVDDAPACVDPDMVVTSDLVGALKSAPDGARLQVWHGQYGDIVIDKAVDLVGVTAEGVCVPVLGEGGPVFSSLHVTGNAEGASIRGIGSTGTIQLASDVRLARFHVRGATEALVVDGPAQIDQFLLTGNQTGLVVRADATVTNGLVVGNEGDGIRLKGPSTLGGRGAE